MDVKKAERGRIDAFELWCWRRLLRVPWTARRSNQCILKEISPRISLEGMMLKLKIQYFGHLMWRVDSLEKTLVLGGIGGRRRRGQQMAGWHHWLDGRESEWTPGVGDGQGGLECCDSWGRKESDTTESSVHFCQCPAMLSGLPSWVKSFQHRVLRTLDMNAFRQDMLSSLCHGLNQSLLTSTFSAQPMITSEFGTSGGKIQKE